MNVVIIGGVAAGMSAASKLKRLDKSMNIIVLEKGRDVSYGACGLPYFVSDMIKDEDKLVARTADKFRDNGIDVRLESEVDAVDFTNKTVHVKTDDDAYTLPYDKLVIATGASAIQLPIPGRDLENIHPLNSLEDGRQLKALVQDSKVQSVAVIGGGYIGVEVAETLLEAGKSVTLIERESRLLMPFESFAAERVHAVLEASGARIYKGETAQAYEGDKVVKRVKTDQRTIEADVVIEAVGIKPNTQFLKHTNIALANNGAILTNEAMETSIKDVYAAGDCVSYIDALDHSKHRYIPLGTHANKAGRVIAEQIAGNDKTFAGVIGSSVLKVLDLEVARTGYNLDEARSHGYQADHVRIKARDKAGYYPHALPLEIDLVYDPKTCVILGATMVGSGIAHRINTAAIAVMQRMRADTFGDLDLAYAPPFSPVYDPVQIAANQIKCKGGKDA